MIFLVVTLLKRASFRWFLYWISGAAIRAGESNIYDAVFVILKVLQRVQSGKVRYHLCLFSLNKKDKVKLKILNIKQFNILFILWHGWLTWIKFHSWKKYEVDIAQIGDLFSWEKLALDLCKKYRESCNSKQLCNIEKQQSTFK